MPSPNPPPYRVRREHACGPSCFCRVHGFAMYFAPENEELPEAGEHACIIPDCAVWAKGDRGAVLSNERSGYVCNCESYAEEVRGHTIEGYAQQFHKIVRIVHKPSCLLFDPPCFDCFGYAARPDASREPMGTVFRCPFHDRANQSLLRRFEGMFIEDGRAPDTPRNTMWSGIEHFRK